MFLCNTDRKRKRVIIFAFTAFCAFVWIWRNGNQRLNDGYAEKFDTGSESILDVYLKFLFKTVKFSQRFSDFRAVSANSKVHLLGFYSWSCWTIVERYCFKLARKIIAWNAGSDHCPIFTCGPRFAQDFEDLKQKLNKFLFRLAANFRRILVDCEQYYYERSRIFVRTRRNDFYVERNNFSWKLVEKNRDWKFEEKTAKINFQREIWNRGRGLGDDRRGRDSFLGLNRQYYRRISIFTKRIRKNSDGRLVKWPFWLFDDESSFIFFNECDAFCHSSLSPIIKSGIFSSQIFGIPMDAKKSFGPFVANANVFDFL